MAGATAHTVLSLDVIAQLWAPGESFAGMGRKLGVSRSIVAGRIDPGAQGWRSAVCAKTETSRCV